MTINNTVVGLTTSAGTISPQKITSITFDGIGALHPLPDITPLESLNISIMLAFGNMSGLHWWDFKEYVDRNNLGRHFANG